ncbi:MAG: radical SAM protein [Candidatus Bipolaricaulia bacterium]
MNQVPEVPFSQLDTLWFQVAGTLCNLKCIHCFISCSPTNDTHGMLSLETVKRYLPEAEALGVKEYYFTGGEPFLNRELLDILQETIRFGPVTVLTNGLLLTERVIERLKQIKEGSRYSLELRVSLDGYTKAMNDRIRGRGTFRRIVQVLKQLTDHGFLPIVATTEVWTPDDLRRLKQGGGSEDKVYFRLKRLLQNHGIDRPRIKIIPLFRLGQAENHNGGELWHVRPEDLNDFDLTTLQCTSGRMITSRGIYYCPLLISQEEAKLGDRLKDTLKPTKLFHSACYTCYLTGFTCSNV